MQWYQIRKSIILQSFNNSDAVSGSPCTKIINWNHQTNSTNPKKKKHKKERPKRKNLSESDFKEASRNSRRILSDEIGVTHESKCVHWSVRNVRLQQDVHWQTSESLFFFFSFFCTFHCLVSRCVSSYFDRTLGLELVQLRKLFFSTRLNEKSEKKKRKNKNEFSYDVFKLGRTANESKDIGESERVGLLLEDVVEDADGVVANVEMGGGLAQIGGGEIGIVEANHAHVVQLVGCCHDQLGALLHQIRIQLSLFVADSVSEQKGKAKEHKRKHNKNNNKQRTTVSYTMGFLSIRTNK